MSSHNPGGPVAVVLGTRPEIIKMARIVDLLGTDVHLVHTGQHYDATLSDDFFSEFGMRHPDTVVGVGGQSRGQQIGNATAALDSLFESLRPSAVVVQGDTNAVAAGCLAANANAIPLVHVEAGLRSYDRRMPEEHNRVIADHLSDLCLAPTPHNVAQLLGEGISKDRIELTGNPVVEAVERLMPSPEEQSEALQARGMEPDRYVLATIHRPENVDNRDTLVTILQAFGAIKEPVLIPMHPRTRSRIEEFGLEELTRALNIVEPIGYQEFLGLGANAGLIVSDSGGIQEEVSVYKRPAVVVRRSTERQEVEGTFVTRVAPDDSLAETLRSSWQTASERRAALAKEPSPYGTPESPQLCVAAIQRIAFGAST